MFLSLDGDGDWKDERRCVTVGPERKVFLPLILSLQLKHSYSSYSKQGNHGTEQGSDSPKVTQVPKTAYVFSTNHRCYLS